MKKKKKKNILQLLKSATAQLHCTFVYSFKWKQFESKDQILKHIFLIFYLKIMTDNRNMSMC